MWLCWSNAEKNFPLFQRKTQNAVVCFWTSIMRSLQIPQIVEASISSEKSNSMSQLCGKHSSLNISQYDKWFDKECDSNRTFWWRFSNLKLVLVNGFRCSLCLSINSTGGEKKMQADGTWQHVWPFLTLNMTGRRLKHSTYIMFH
jgi:hypothetical protein